MAYSFEQYSEYKASGALLESTPNGPQLTLSKFHERTGQSLSPDVLTVDTIALDFWITEYQKKLTSLQALKQDIERLTV